MRENKTPGEKAAETRASNTRKEVIFLANAYYDCALFVSNSGFMDIGIVNQQFEDMVKRYVEYNKIKRESYNKFQSIISEICAFNYSKTNFVEKVIQKFDIDVAMENTQNIDKMMIDFGAFLRNNSIQLSDAQQKILFMQLYNSIAQATKSETMKNTVKAYKARLGLTNVRFTSPQIKVYDDGCSHGVSWGNVLTNMGMLNKYKLSPYEQE